jgi:steroid 5-alpha reductase family enzyme
MSHLVIHLGVFALVHSLIWFAISLFLSRNDVADVGWGTGFIILTLTLLLTQPLTPVGVVLLLMVSFWGLRLSWHIGSRLLRSEEDFRYAAWRRTWGRTFVIRSYLQVFFLQNLILLVLATPIILILTAAHPGGAWSVFGGSIWLLGFLTQAVADKQLADFARDPRNRGSLLTKGLWKHSRHPNYLGEIGMWAGIAIMALQVPLGWIGLVSPLLLSWLLLYVSGVPLLEERMAKRPGWDAYKSQTPVLFPWKWLLSR